MIARRLRASCPLLNRRRHARDGRDGIRVFLALSTHGEPVLKWRVVGGVSSYCRRRDG
jgi:hypothetical protein